MSDLLATGADSRLTDTANFIEEKQKERADRIREEEPTPIPEEEEKEEKKPSYQPSSGRGEGRSAFRDTNVDYQPTETQEEIASGIVSGGLSAVNSVLTAPERYYDMVTGKPGTKDYVDENYVPDWAPLKNIEHPVTKTWWGGLLENVVHYGLLAYLTKKAGGKLIPKAPVPQGMVLGAGAAVLSDKSQDNENMSSMISKRVPWLSPIFDATAVKSTDHPLLKTFKNVVEEAGFGAVIDKLILRLFPDNSVKAIARQENIEKQIAEKAAQEWTDDQAFKRRWTDHVIEGQRGLPPSGDIEEVIVRVEEPDIPQIPPSIFRGNKNSPVADFQQGAPNSTGTPGEIYEQLNEIYTSPHAYKGSTDSLFTSAQTERMASQGGMSPNEMEKIAKEILGDAKYQSMLRELEAQNASWTEIFEDALNRTQEVLGRLEAGEEDIWTPLFKDLNPDIINGIENWNARQMVAGDLINHSLFKKLRDLSIGAREIDTYADIFAVDGPMKTIADNLVIGLTEVKKTRYLWGAKGRQMQLGDLSFEKAFKIRSKELHDETIDGVRLMMQMMKNADNKELADGILEVFSMSNKITNWTDFDNWMRAKLIGGEFGGKVNTGRLIKELQGVMINSVLSGPKTPLRAIMGTSSNAYINQANQALGAVIRAHFNGDVVTKNANIAALRSMVEIIPDAWKVFKTKLDSYWTGDIADIRTRYSKYNKADENWEVMRHWIENGKDVKDSDRAAFYIANIARGLNDSTFFNYSTKIMAATDDTFRFVMAKARSREKALRSVLDAQDKGVFVDITPDILKQAEDLHYRELLDADGNINFKSDEFLKNAFEEVTLTKDLKGVSKDLEKVFNAKPWLKPWFLFARTGINGLELTLKNSPGLAAIQKEWRDVLFANDYKKVIQYGINSADELANAKSLIIGRQATGFGVTAMLATAYQSGVFTGNGPQNRQMRQMWIDTGWKPRSIRIGDAWVSYDSIEPYNLILSTMADIGDHQREMGDQWTQDALGKVGFTLGSMLQIFADNATGKSYIEGLNQLVNIIQQPGITLGKAGGNLLNNQVPLSSLRNDIGKLMNPYMRELSANLIDQIRNRNLTSEHLTNDPLPIKYDLLNGEPLRDWNFMNRMFNVFSPVQLNFGGSPGRDLLWRSNYDMRLSVYYAPDGTDLTNHPNIRSKFQQAIGKYNLERTLDNLAARDDVQASLRTMEEIRRTRPDVDPQQSFLHNDLIRNAFNKARTNAWADIKNDPEIQELIQTAQEKEVLEKQLKTKTRQEALPFTNSY